MWRIVLLGSWLLMESIAAVRIEKTEYAGWKNCYRISNGEIELIAVADIGPRIMRFGFPGGQNLFYEAKGSLGKSGESSWQGRGGHRLWIAPESRTLTYALDNRPVQAEVKGDVLILTQPVEPETGLEKQMRIEMAAAGNRVTVRHSLRNTRTRGMSLAPWSLTMMAPGGLGIYGFPPRGSHSENLLPTNPLVMWAYTDLSDPRWKWMRKYFTLRQDPSVRSPQKIGLFAEQTWAAYLLGEELFVKRSIGDPKAVYPDFGCTLETYTGDSMLELETLGPLGTLAAGATVQHDETWSLHKGVKLPETSDEVLDRLIAPLVR